MAASKRRKRTNRRRARRWTWAAVIILLIAAIAMAAAAFSRTNNTEAVHLYIDADDTTDSVTTHIDTLTSTYGLIGFRLLAQAMKYEGNERTGHYVIAPHTTMVDLVKQLRSGEQQPVRMVIPPARHLGTLCAQLSRSIMLDSATIADALTDDTLCASLGYTVQTIPALFIPNTYEIYWNVTLKGLFQRMKRENDAFWTPERRARADSLGLTPTEVATLASIVDSETANNAEKPTIAGLYLNRLRINMPLQSDPTVIYAISDFTIRRVSYDHLRTESPYNTYLHTGLPPGPIRIPSIAAIDAVLYAPRHDYLYMCAKADFSGTHAFATTYTEHQRNARAYARALNERGIKIK